MARRSKEFIRGARKPFVVLFTSSMAELSGAEPSVLMATWALMDRLINVSSICFLILFVDNQIHKD